MKMASQRFCLRWNNHQSNLLSVFDQLLHAETFTDVTLAVDGQYLKAHKMVLSACSPYFNNLFVNHPEKHPIVILKDVPYSDMKSLLDFMYRGEVSVDQERLTAFLRVAESLRIKGLTEVNDDKPSVPEPTPPPQLQRIQPYLVQQQQQQRNKSQSNFVNNNNNNNNNAPQMQTQQSLLSSALASMPKRKRGRPRKLSGSSNGTGNDYDEFEREGMLNDSDMGDRKLNESFSGNDDGSDDNQRDSFDNDNDMDDNRDSSTQAKKQKTSKEMMKAQQNDDNSTSVQLVNNSPELSQILFGLSKGHPTGQKIAMTPVATQSNQSQQNQIIDITDTAPQLPAALGLRIRNTHKQSSQITINTNSLLKQQLRAGPKDVDTTTMGNSNKLGTNALENMSNNDACSALQSLASVAERQAPNTIQPPTANNLHQQFLLHLATNPMMKASNDFFQQQQLTQQQQLEDELVVNNLDLTLESNDKSEPELILADENAGLDYKLHENGANDSNILSINDGTLEKLATNTPTRPIQRRRIRRKAQSSLDDQAEHLTEMSVRGLDLFRYASISEGVYQCTECAKENVQKTFKNKYSFQRHAFLYHEGKHRKVFPCPLCGKEFSRPDKMKNHMKMTHESFATKDNSNFNPLNYLITAAANETHPTVYSQHTVGQQQKAHILNEATTDDYMGINLTQQNSPMSPKPGAALLKLQNDIIIKNEIVISPSPSPPPKVEMETTQRLEEVK